jgi:FMN phosphatase YigB (HAD superfamily)
MKNINHVFLDLDGVVFDFYSAVGDQLHDRDKWWNEGFPAFIDSGGFADLPLLPDADELIAFLENSPASITILSSAGGSPKFEEIVDQKLEALYRNAIDFPTIIVPSWGIKKDFAGPNSLLIDDHTRNCEDFIEAGGEAIVHTNAAATIAYIKEHYTF